MEIQTLASSSSGNSSLVSHGGTHVLIDAGISCKRIKLALQTRGLELRDLSAVLVTHSHGDHVGGLQTLSKHSNVNIFATEQTLCSISPVIAAGTQLDTVAPGGEFTSGALSFRVFATSHDAPGSVGFVVEADGRRLIFATDLGIVTQEILDMASGAQLALIESNHDLQMLKCGYYPPSLKRRIMSDVGHLSNLAGASFALQLSKSGARRIILAHLSHENNTPELAYQCTYERLNKAGAEVGGDVMLSVAPRDTAGELFTV
jgi:Metal-dependent hydrolases of the beta-lactamase superfamily I